MFFQKRVKVDIRVVRVDVMGAVSVDFGQAGSFGDDDLRPTGKGFQWRDSKPFEVGREDQSLAFLHQCFDLSVGQVSGKYHVGQSLQHFQRVRDKAGNGFARNDELLVLMFFRIVSNPFEILAF